MQNGAPLLQRPSPPPHQPQPQPPQVSRCASRCTATRSNTVAFAQGYQGYQPLPAYQPGPAPQPEIAHVQYGQSGGSGEKMY